jgi:3-deoxy-D-manno-octulosonate 8-phosphate phosphatase KdsC-like HAD superfamily phosphatase
MFKVAGVSVAMKNSLDYVKKHATFETNLTNVEGGVGDFIDDFLDNPKEYIAKAKESKTFIIKKKKNINGSYH